METLAAPLDPSWQLFGLSSSLGAACDTLFAPFETLLDVLGAHFAAFGILLETLTTMFGLSRALLAAQQQGRHLRFDAPETSASNKWLPVVNTSLAASRLRSTARILTQD